MKSKEMPSDKMLQPPPGTGAAEEDLGSDHQNVILLTAGVLLAILLRYLLLPFESGDYIVHFGKWYDFIVENGNFSALKYGFANYNIPLLYLMTTCSVLFPESSKILILKGISIVFDFALAFFVYKCVSFKCDRRKATLAALAALLTPTVVLNGAMWGQWDSIYTTFLVACIYFLLIRRQAAAFIAFGLAFSFKLQAVFLAPFFLWLSVKKKVRIRYFLLALLCWFALLLPAWLIGRPFGELLSVYINQSFVYSSLSESAPNLYQWISDDYYSFYPAGIALTAGIASVIAIIIYKSQMKITTDRLIFLAFLSVLLTPYVLPKMHDRYFFPADVIAIIFAFYWPRYWYAPIVVGLTSLVTYVRFLAGGAIILPLSWLAVVLLIFIGVLGRQFFRIFWKRRIMDGA